MCPLYLHNAFGQIPEKKRKKQYARTRKTQTHRVNCSAQWLQCKHRTQSHTLAKMFMLSHLFYRFASSQAKVCVCVQQVGEKERALQQQQWKSENE